MALDPRIGILNSGKYYAFVNGYDQPEFTGTLEEVEIALGIREPALSVAPKAALVSEGPKLKKYNVHMTFQYPAWNEKDGYWYDGIIARNKREANKRARSMADDDGHTCGNRVWFKAYEQE